MMALVYLFVMYLFILTIWSWHVWGRKDPMLPDNGIGDTDKTCYTTETQYAFQHTGLNTNDIKEYIRNPHKFNTNGKMDGQYYNLWSTDNDRTDGNDELVIKSVYDPSPVGYSLPAPNAFTGFTTTGQRIGNWTNPVTPANPNDMNAKLPFDNGYYFYTKPNKQGNTIFFPTPGRRLHTTGTLFIDNVGTAQTAGNNNINIEAGLYFDKNIISPITDFSHSWGLPVRSAEEKVLKCGLKKLQIVCNFGENCNITTLKIRIFII